ncbi:folate-binding protein [Salinisphaera sp. T31B1]|uniref:CAF17-like 4Fe-4S cluster assembly/insertion protein YgfZ n=1 Tax=Salinisphaera sp. T31B1 TaxID=727963 RepID=UPI003341A771
MNSATRQTGTALGIICVQGPDAASFLRAQLTNDVARLGPDRHFLAAWCDAKGRTEMIARVVETETDGYLLILPQALIEPMIKRLQMYVLRAKVALSDMTGERAVYGLTGATLPAPGHTEARAGMRVLGLPASRDGAARALVIGDNSVMPASNDAMATDDERWLIADIDAGLPVVLPATRGLFVPQMLNLHWLMAIDFDKGCYPGQEIIARLHYRGTLTRRTFRLHWQGERPIPGERITDSEDNEVGTVIAAARDGSPNHGRLLAVLKAAAIGADTLTCPQTALTLGDLPYPTPD